jgi:hypothetical protein
MTRNLLIVVLVVICLGVFQGVKTRCASASASASLCDRYEYLVKRCEGICEKLPADAHVDERSCKIGCTGGVLVSLDEAQCDLEYLKQ